MTDVVSQGLVDILPLDSMSGSSDQIILLIYISMLIIFFITLYLFRYWKKPVRSIRRQLLNQQLSVREAAHLVAGLMQNDVVKIAKLNEIRFSKIEPTQQQLLNLMSQIESQ